jgi:hypothetical protein
MQWHQKAAPQANTNAEYTVGLFIETVGVFRKIPLRGRKALAQGEGGAASSIGGLYKNRGYGIHLS